MLQPMMKILLGLNLYMNSFKYTKCRCCGNPFLTKWFSLPNSPVANALFDKPNFDKFPLDLNFCTSCSHLQLDSAPDPDGVFSKYRYRSGVSKSFQKHFSEYAKDIVQLEGPGKVLEIGSNDGYLLEKFKELNCEVFGVEPSEFLREDHTKRGINVNTGFFSPEMVTENHWEDSFDIICANNVLAHIPDTFKVIFGAWLALKPNGILVAECGDQQGIFDGSCLDNVYHEHIDYYSPYSFATLAKRANLVVESVERINSHGVSFRIIARKKDGDHKVQFNRIYLDKYRDMVQKGIHSRRLRIQEKLKTRKFFAYGAAAKAVTSLYTLGLVDEGLIGVVDDNELKQGCYFPGTDLKIENPEKLKKDAVVLVTAWNVFDDIKDKLVSRGHRGEIICI